MSEDKRQATMAAAEALFGVPRAEPQQPEPPVPPLRMITQKIATADWLRMSDVEKIKANYGCNLDQIRDLCAIPWEDADLHEKALIVRVFEIHMRTGRSFARDKSRERETATLLRGVRATLEGRIAREIEPAH